MSQEQLNTNIDSLLDSTLDDLADLPEFLLAPSGAHRATIKSFVVKKIGEKQMPELTFTAIETVELADPTEDQPLTPGTEYSVVFGLDNEYGQGAFKEVMKALTPAVGGGSNREVMENSKGTEVLTVMLKKADKNGTMRSNLKKLEVL